MRRAARECGTDRKTVRRYYDASEQCGLEADVELADEVVARVAALVQGRPAPPPSDVGVIRFRRQGDYAACPSDIASPARPD